MKLTLLDTPIVKIRISKGNLQQVLIFLIKNTTDIVLDAQQMKALATTKLYNSTPINRIYQSLVAADKLNVFACYNLANKADVPELLTLDDISLDGKEINSRLPVPTQLRKVFINLTPIVSKTDPYNDGLNVTDVSQLANLFVRGLLVASYNDSDMWLNYKLSAQLMEFYSGIVSFVLGQVYNLDLGERLFVQTLFATYYAQLLGEETSDLAFPPLLLRCSFLGSSADIVSRMEMIKEYRPNAGNSLLNIPVIVKILKHIGPSRMRKIEEVQLYRYLSASSIDSQTMMIAIDYPPYWLYQLMKVVSGYKNPIISNYLKITGSKPKIVQFISEIETSNVLLQRLERD